MPQAARRAPRLPPTPPAVDDACAVGIPARIWGAQLRLPGVGGRGHDHGRRTEGTL